MVFMIIVLSGSTGAGKSSIARHIAKMTGFTHLEGDAIRREHFGDVQEAQGPKGAFRLTFEKMREMARTSQKPVILDYVFTDHDLAELMALGKPVHAFVIRTHPTKLRQRRPTESDASWIRLAKQKSFRDFRQIRSGDASSETLANRIIRIAKLPHA